jgi:hypothetical protein
MGDTLAFLVDFLEGGRPIFRVYFQDSPTNGTRGYVHPDVLAERGVDLAILGAGAFNQVADHPDGILRNLRPRHILLGHWDDFFAPVSAGVRSLPFHPFDDLVRRLERATGASPASGRYHFPAPGSLFVYPIERTP